MPQELSFSVSPTRTVLFSKTRLVLFSPKMKSQQFPSQMLPNHRKIGNIYLMNIQVFIKGRFSPLTLVLLMVKGEMVIIGLIGIISVVFPALQNELQIVSLLVTATPLVENENPFISSVEFYATLDGTSIECCEFDHQG